jgi:hypothetical protein
MTRAEGISVLASIRGDLGAFSLRCPRAHAGRPDATRHPKRFSVSAAVWLLGWLWPVWQSPQDPCPSRH